MTRGSFSAAARLRVRFRARSWTLPVRALPIWALPVLLCLPTGGCGFHPLHGGATAADAHLPDIFVANIIAGRPGQLLRQALQQRLAGSSEMAPQGYTLRVSLALDGEAIGIHGDNTSARTRVIGRAYWALSSIAANPVSLASGSAITVDGFNIIENQYFEAIMANESTDQRVADNLADRITTQVASWFVAHPDGGSAGAAPAAAVAPPIPAINTAPGFLGTQGVPGNTNQSPLQQVGPDGLPSDAIGRTGH